MPDEEQQFIERYRDGTRRLRALDTFLLADADARIEKFRGCHAPGDGDVSPAARAALAAFLYNERMRDILAAERAS